MKKLSNLSKLLAVFALGASVSLLMLTAFSNKKSPSPGSESGIIETRQEAKDLYANFERVYPENVFAQHGGVISKATLTALLSAMRDGKDVNVYYYFGRTPDDKNMLMLFNDPAYSDPANSPKYKTVAPYCPPECNTALQQYLTGE
jgi:hypothetical protein